MIAVIFEVEPAPARRQDYLDTAQALRASLDEVDGFISVERFTSITHPGRLLSLSQAAGRDGVFCDYRLRVAHVVRDYGMHQRAEAPPDSRAAHS
jgi:heme-degrading monooxygenase HmoA